MRKAIFIDKDGTLIQNVHYSADASKVKLMNGICTGLRQLAEAGYLLLVVTNQAGLAFGYFTEQALQQSLDAMYSQLEKKQVIIDGIYYCPHHIYATVPRYRIKCNCQKPAPGLLLKAAKDWDIDLAESWMIGDIWTDVEAGQQAGCSTILVDPTGREAKSAALLKHRHHVAVTLNEAAIYILQKQYA